MFNFLKGHHSFGGRYAAGWGAYKRSRNQPHQSTREITRRLAQGLRNELNQRERASKVIAIPPDRKPERVSRRWRWMA